MSDLVLIMRAAEFAAFHHRDQRRKGPAAQPYINHCLAVAGLLTAVGGVTDSVLIAAALLHDVVEDTPVTAEQIEAEFGAAVAAVVAEVTDDKSLPKAERKRMQVVHAAHKSARAKQLKIADKIHNISSLLSDPPPWPQDRLSGYVEWSTQVVAPMRGINPGLDKAFDAVVAETQLAWK